MSLSLLLFQNADTESSLNVVTFQGTYIWRPAFNSLVKDSGRGFDNLLKQDDLDKNVGVWVKNLFLYELPLYMKAISPSRYFYL